MEISPDYFIMTDQGDGTYTADYSCGIEGTVTLIPYLFKQNQILVNFYPDKIFTPPAVHNETWPQVNQDYNTGVIFGTYTDSISASIYFVIKVPVTEEYTFTLESNDGSDLYMNSTIMISQLGVTCNCSSSFDVNLTQNTYVDFQINYIEIADEAHINLKWNSSTISTAQLIPNSVLYYKEYIGSPPYHTEIKCDKYYSSGNPDHPFECYEICGDGVRIGRELCDDKNEKSGDGCSKDCRTIEDRYVCRTYTDEKTPDRCIKCKSGYVRNSDETDCERASKRKMNESLGYLTYALVGVDLGLCLIVFLFTKQSLNAFTMTISYLQVVILMGMLNAEMPENFLGFITEISEMMLPLGFLSRESISGTYLG